jgi:hypothetical protein
MWNTPHQKKAKAMEVAEFIAAHFIHLAAHAGPDWPATIQSSRGDLLDAKRRRCSITIFPINEPLMVGSKEVFKSLPPGGKRA